jgi:hypothetical protein
MINCIDCGKAMEHVSTTPGKAWHEASYRCNNGCRMTATVETTYSYDFSKDADEAERKLGEREAKSRPATEEAKEPKPEDFATVGECTEALTDFQALRHRVALADCRRGNRQKEPTAR